MNRLLTIILLCCFSSSYAKPVLNIQRWQTDNHIPVYFVASQSVPMLDVNVMFHAGSAYDGKQAGLAALTNGLLDTGTKDYTEETLAKAFSGTAGILGLGASRDSASVSLRTLLQPKILTKNIALLNQVLTQPVFPEKPFARVKAQQRQAILHQKQQPGATAAKAFYKTLYGNLPYAHSTLGNTTSVNNLHLSDVRDFYQRYYTQQNALIIMVGDVSTQQARSLANTISQHLNKGKAAPKLPTSTPLKHAITKTIDFPSKQTHILLGRLGVTRDNPDYFPLMLGNYILGGGSFSSRLFKIIREKNGLAYSVYSTFVKLQQAGPFIIKLQTRDQKAKQAYEMSLKTLKTFTTVGPTKKELSLAKQYINGSFPLAFSSNAGILANLSAMAFYQLPLDYFDTYRQRINAVSTSDITQAYRILARDNPLVTIIVGTPFNGQQNKPS